MRRTWILPGWEDIMQKWYEWLVTQIIKSAEGSAGRLHEISKTNSMEERGADLGMRGCWIVVKQKGKNGQSIGSVMRRCRMWRRSLGRMRN